MAFSVRLFVDLSVKDGFKLFGVKSVGFNFNDLIFGKHPIARPFSHWNVKIFGDSTANFQGGVERADAYLIDLVRQANSIHEGTAVE